LPYFPRETHSKEEDHRYLVNGQVKYFHEPREALGQQPSGVLSLFFLQAPRQPGCHSPSKPLLATVSSEPPLN
jgi:hypothetical protein